MQFGYPVNLTQLRHILAVARHRSFSRAAEEEGISQPALSRSIAKFEQNHRVQLFDRSSSGVRPTAMGLIVIDESRSILASAGRLERGLRGGPGGQSGRMALGIGPLAASMFLPRLVPLLWDAYPGLHISTRIRITHELIPDLLGDRIEFIIGSNWNLGRIPGIEIEALGSIPMAIMARSGHPLAGLPNVCAADLDEYPHLESIELAGSNMVRDAGLFVCDNFHLARDVVLRTNCLWRSSPSYLGEDIRAGRLQPLYISDEPISEVDIYVLFKRGSSRSRTSTTMINGLKAILEADQIL
jgi:DNA-binding transcriptional LysR family regulator